MDVAKPPSADAVGGNYGAAQEPSSNAHGQADAGVHWWRTGKAFLVATLAVLVGLAWLLSTAFPRQAYWIYLVATVIAVVPFGRRAVALARAGSPFSIETLMSVAALGAVAIGAAQEAAVVVVLFAFGELLENVAAGRARAGIRALAGLIPRTARRENAGGPVEEVSADQLAIGEVLQIRPGDRVPCDGHCHVNPGADGVTAGIIVASRSCCVLGARLLAPDIEGLRPDVAVVRGCELMSAGMEVTVNEGVGGKKVLGLPGRFEPLHLPLSSSCWSM